MADKPQLTSWSASRLADYDRCPAYAKHKHIEKLPEPGNKAANRGTEIHEKAAGYLAGHTKTLAKELKAPTVAKLMRALRKGYVDRKVWVELMLCFDKSWKLVKDKFAPEVWLRVKCDVIDRRDEHIIEIVDWKTGRFKPDADFDEQLSLYTTAALSAYGGDRATARLVFTDHGEEVRRPGTDVTPETLREAQKAWEKRTKPMMNDKWFATKPGPHCQWCPYSRNEDGPCEF